MPILPTDWKATFRKQATARRKAAHQDQPLAPVRAAGIFMHHIAPADDKIIALYHPFGAELDTSPLAAQLRQAGHPLCLPVVRGKNEPLIFRHFDIDQPLEEGAYGIMTPPVTAGELRPDIIVVPLLAFRRDGARLGMGGGFYDRSLNGLRAAHPGVIAVGYAYGSQEMTPFPVEAHDARLDAIVTDLEYIGP